MVGIGKRLLMFTGRECVHCHRMEPSVERLEKELKVKVERLEVWHDSRNMAFLESIDKGFCGGVPFFFSEKSGRWICGEAGYEQLKAWALG